MGVTEIGVPTLLEDFLSPPVLVKSQKFWISHYFGVYIERLSQNFHKGFSHFPTESNYKMGGRYKNLVYNLL